ncbi:hypothetical protein AAG906_007384 [Vitis piasezkii]
MNAYDRTEEFNFKDETRYSNLIDALCEYKHVIEAEELFIRESKDLVFNDDWKKCREFWEEMDWRSGCKSLCSYSIYMDIQCKGGRPWRAGIRLDVVAYNAVIRAIGLSEGVDFSIRVFREMKELGCEPNVVTYDTIIKLLCEHGRIREAYGVLDQMCEKDCAPNVMTYQLLFRVMDTYVMLMKKFGRWGILLLRSGAERYGGCGSEYEEEMLAKGQG